MTNEELIISYREAKATEKSKAMKSIMNKLIEQNKPFIYYFAKRYLPLIKHNRFDIDDLIQEGWIAFLDAVERFDIDGKNLFTTFAGSNIRFSILNFINRRCIDREKKKEVNQRIITVSMDSILPGAEDLTIGETIEDREALNEFDQVDFEIDNLILRCDLLDTMDAVFGDCDHISDQSTMNMPILKKILLLRYGFYGQPMSFSDIGHQLGFSDSLAAVKHDKAIWKIRHCPASNWLLKKYRDMIVENMKEDKSSLYELKEPALIVGATETINSRIKAIDNLLDNILNVS